MTLRPILEIPVLVFFPERLQLYVSGGEEHGDRYEHDCPVSIYQ
jgi:hypothetical protein